MNGASSWSKFFFFCLVLISRVLVYQHISSQPRSHFNFQPWQAQQNKTAMDVTSIPHSIPSVWEIGLDILLKTDPREFIFDDDTTKHETDVKAYLHGLTPVAAVAAVPAAPFDCHGPLGSLGSFDPPFCISDDEWSDECSLDFFSVPQDMYQLFDILEAETEAMIKCDDEFADMFAGVSLGVSLDVSLDVSLGFGESKEEVARKRARVCV